MQGGTKLLNIYVTMWGPCCAASVLFLRLCQSVARVMLLHSFMQRTRSLQHCRLWTKRCRHTYCNLALLQPASQTLQSCSQRTDSEESMHGQLHTLLYLHLPDLVVVRRSEHFASDAWWSKRTKDQKIDRTQV